MEFLNQSTKSIDNQTLSIKQLNQLKRNQRKLYAWLESEPSLEILHINAVIDKLCADQTESILLFIDQS
jgi:hypothetical protein